MKSIQLRFAQGWVGNCVPLKDRSRFAGQDMHSLTDVDCQSCLSFFSSFFVSVWQVAHQKHFVSYSHQMPHTVHFAPELNSDQARAAGLSLKRSRPRPTQRHAEAGLDQIFSKILMPCMMQWALNQLSQVATQGFCLCFFSSCSCCCIT